MLSAQIDLWNTYTWWGRLFTSWDQVITVDVSSQPVMPTPPAPSSMPGLDAFEFMDGGSGAPLSGEISLSPLYSGQYKYFGVLGQS